MTDAQQREAARQFFYRWNNKGKEDEHARSYWIELLSDVFGVERVTERVEFEKKVAGEKSKKRIDVYIPETHVVIEQKSMGIPLDKPQQGHDGKTPYEQAKEYDNLLPYEERARWIITSNFSEIWIYDMSVMRPEPVKLTLDDLQTKYHLLDFLVNKKRNKITEEVELSKAAGELVGKIRDRFLTQYNDPLAKRTQKSLNILCVRLVFCFYAEDAGLFGQKDAFSRYILQYKPGDIRGKLMELFRVLDTPIYERADLYLDDETAAFPYVNGGLFSDENIVIPRITQEIKDALAEAARFDWSKISPTIFGAVFESTLNPETRRAGGMHYTSIENIHKLIDPLFLDALREELKEIRNIVVLATQKKRLNAYQDKLASLVFLDPACGSGNFLTETYLSLRRLENEVLRLKVAADRKLMNGQISFGFEEDSPIKVSIHQFYGIEINDFACSVAQTALWIAETQMRKETEGIIHAPMDYFPLQTYTGITEGNALQILWEQACPVNKLNYIIGNPPFVGKSFQTTEQKAEMKRIFYGVKNYGNLDYVTCWFKKAADIMVGTSIKCSFVATNSICQGIAVPPLWNHLLNDKKIKIIFAYPTFKWASEASDAAAVHCVIVGMSYEVVTNPMLYKEDGTVDKCNNINAYLVDGPNIIIEDRHEPIGDVPKTAVGSFPTDGGNLVIKAEEYDAFLSLEPKARPYIKAYIGPEEFIKNKKRYCLWLKDCPPGILNKLPAVMERVQGVYKYRSNSKKEQTRRRADIPTRFAEDRQPDDNYILIPRTSSERRRYIPMGFFGPDVIAGDTIIVPGAKIYHFGILESNVHMAWVRAVCGRLKSDYRYSGSLLYNTFPWPDPTPSQKQMIERTAQGILEARALYPDSSLADLYNPLTMPIQLRKAHQQNDKAVMQAYGMPIKETDEPACVAWLMRLYQEKTSGIGSH